MELIYLMIVCVLLCLFKGGIFVLNSFFLILMKWCRENKIEFKK